MKLILWACEGATGITAVAIVVAFFTIIALGIGCIAYLLLSIIFPEYIVFGWYWWRFLALGILLLFID